MKQLLHSFTIGVKDLDKMKKFYIDTFGWTPLKDTSNIVFFKLNGFILTLYPQDDLAAYVTVQQNGQGFKRFALAINLNSEQAVDKTFAKLKKSGAKVVKKPKKVFWGGYSGFVADIEDNYWEIGYNPFLELDKKGNVITHK
jgi:uncharacterized protein